MDTDRNTTPQGEPSPEDSLREAKVLAESIVEAAHEPFLVLTPQLRVQSANLAFYQHWAVDPEETLGRRIYDLGNGQWDIPALRTLLEDVLPDNNVFYDFEVRHNFHHIGKRVMLVNARRLDHVQLILLGIRDITEQTRTSDALRESEERYAYLLQLSDALRPLADPVEIQATAARVLGERLRADRAYYVAIDERNDQFVVARDWYQPGAPSHAGRTPLADWRISWLNNGETWVVRDADVDAAMPDDQRDGYRSRDIRALIVVPLIKEGRLAATFVASQRQPREWTPIEIALVEETAERTWAAVERARAEAALRESEERFRQIAENVREVFWIFTPDFSRVLYMSPAYEAVTGRPVEGIYRNVRDFLNPVHPEDQPALIEAMQRIGQEAIHVEFRLRHADGSERWLLTRGYPVRDAQGRVYRVVGTSQDVTERKRADQNVRESEQHLRQILDALPIGVILADASGQISWHNPASDRIWAGVRPARLDEFGQYKAWWPDTGERLRIEEWPLARALQGETVLGEVTDIEAFDGARRTTLNSAVPLLGEAGEIAGALVVQEDITIRQAQDAQMRLLNRVLEQSTQAILILKEDLTVLFMNEAAQTLFGADADGSYTLTDFLPEGEIDEAERAILDAVHAKGSWSGRVHRRRVDGGGVVIVDVIYGAVTGADGRRLYFKIYQDAMDSIAREQQLRRAERLASVGTLIGGVAHELNNPLHAIYNFSELMLMDERPEGDRESLEIIRRESERMAKIVSDLKQIARNTQEEVQERGAVDLNEVVRHVLKVQEYRLKTSNIEVRKDLADDLPRVLGDRGALEQVVLNLVVNAEQAMASHGDKGRLILRTRASTKGAALHVVDTGPGIPPNQLERIWDLFYTTKSEGEGTGLGLSLVHSIIAEHGGEIRVDSQVGTGSAFRIDLPRVLPTYTAPEPAQSRGAEPTPALRVLVVDDEPAVRSVTVRALTRRGHQVDEAAEGAAALQMLTETSYDVILSDLRMPGLGGEAMMEQLQARGLSQKVIFLTGDAGGAGPRLERAGVPVLLKPTKLSDLVRAVEGLGARGRDPEE